MAITERVDAVGTTAKTTGDELTDAYLKAVQQEAANKVSRDEDTGAIYLGKYQIDAAMWKTWAAAAGYPGARWDDPAAANRVAGWAANTLFTEFQNWGLVAIGWRYGPEAARRVQTAYGGTPAGDILQKMLGKGGATFVDRILQTMGNALPAAKQPIPNFAPGSLGSPGGQIDINFVNEQAPPDDFQQRGAKPAHTALAGVLGAMSDRIAGGQRGHVLDVEIEEVSDEAEPVRSTSEEDTTQLEGKA